MWQRAVNGSSGGGGEQSAVWVGKPSSATQFSNIGFKPKKIVFADIVYNTSAKRIDIYDEDYSTTKARYFYNSTSVAEATIGSSYIITDIDDNGFTLNSSYMSYISNGSVIMYSG